MVGRAAAHDVREPWTPAAKGCAVFVAVSCWLFGRWIDDDDVGGEFVGGHGLFSVDVAGVEPAGGVSWQQGGWLA